MMDSELLKKYNVPGPRYTSYPTVPYWDTNPTENEWLQALKNSISQATASGTGAAIYAHLPFCESLCTYCGCNTRITRNHGVSDPYINTILKEFALYREKLGIQKLKLSELHLGGGTPTFFTPSELDRFLDGLLSYCETTPDFEFSIEVDPRVTKREHLEVLRERRFKRISLGIQDFDPKVQDIVNRVQSFEQVKTLTDEARALGFTSVNYDLIYGLPLQTIASIEDTIEKVVRLRPDRIAFYAYAHVPWIKPGQRRFTEADLPSGDQKRALYERGRELLESAGYIEIGMDHFALKSDSLFTAVSSKSLHRNFMGYTARNVNPILALGVSAIGDAWSAFAQNEKLLETYVERVERGEIPIYRGHVLNAEDLILRKHVLNLMTRMETSWADAGERVEYLSEVPAKLQEFMQDALLEMGTNSCTVTEKGRAFLRNICMAFDARLARKAPETRLFSQTV
ncbi:MAG: oxygen-independent coproporphyrinogen III oxidase [Bdellovibrionales bacterium]|nr:oxygen-independent coproporphyrinogen III oxidase [Bdellovibrionales bacterium]